MEKINLDVLKNVLTPKEMKNITGGSCAVDCKGSWHELNCDEPSDCESQAYAVCGDSGWIQNGHCY